MNNYIKQIENNPQLLSTQETNYWFCEYNKGNLTAREVLIKCNLGLVKSIIARRFISDTNFEFEDLYSVGSYALLKAIDTFDLSKKIKFSTYATTCIVNTILKYIRDNKKHYQVISLDESINIDNDLTIKDTLMTEENIQEQYCQKSEIENILEMISSLKKRTIFVLYYGLENNKEHNQEEISNIIGISRAAVSAIMKRELKRIRKQLLNELSTNKNTASKRIKLKK